MFPDPVVRPGPGPAVMRIGQARLTAGLDRYPRLDLETHQAIFGQLPKLSSSQLIAMTREANLRGHGGAGFPSTRKLQAVTDAAGRRDCPPIVVVNATEGEPGSFKDKMLLIRSPYLVLSGAIMTAEALGAKEIIVGVADRELATQSLRAAISAAPGLGNMIRVVEVPERFISGESSALINAVNGRKPIPSGQKTRAAEKGVNSQPTFLSNAETFAQLAVLALLGPTRYATTGTPTEPGTLLLSVSGSAAHPAVVEAPTGTLLGEVLDICEAPIGEGVLVGGYHGMWLPPGKARSAPISAAGFKAAGGTLGAGIILPLGDGTCPLGEATRIAAYLAGESAGQCGPCKKGLPAVARTLTAFLNGSGGAEALDAARRTAAKITGRGACSHPDGTTRFILSALTVFTDDLAAHVFHSTCGHPVKGVLPLPVGPETHTQQRLTVDWSRCRGHGLCAYLAGEIIHLDEYGFPVKLDMPVPDWLRKPAQHAVDMCPELALQLTSNQSPTVRRAPREPAPATQASLTGGTQRW